MNLRSERLAALCAELRLAGVAESFAALATAAVEREQSFFDFLEAALLAERDSRRARSAATLVRMAGFPATKTLEDYDFGFATTAPRRQIEQLASLNFVARRENVVFSVPPAQARPIWRSCSATRRRMPASRPASPPPPT